MWSLRHADPASGGGSQVVFSPDGRLLAAGRKDRVDVWSAPEMKLQVSLSFRRTPAPRWE
jgi:hypothetical protein